MLACIQRGQSFSSQRLACTPKSFDVTPPPPPLLLPAAPLQPGSQKGESAPMTHRYPSPAELDAFAQKTAGAPLSIKIFPSDVRVPQHKQLNKTVNGLDTTGQRYGLYSHTHSGGHQGLLAIVRASAAVRGVLKTSEGRRTKHGSSQTSSMAPYNNPQSNSYALRHGQKAYHHLSSCKPADAPNQTLCSSAAMVGGEQGLAPHPELAEVQSLMRKMGQVPHSQALQLGGEARLSPSLQAVAAVAHSDSDFVLGVPPQSSLAFAGAVPPVQDPGKGGYLDRRGYAAWQHKAQMQQQQQQHYQQRAVSMYSAHSAQGQSPETCLPLPSSSQLPYRWPHGSVGAVQERAGSACLNRTPAQEEPVLGQYFDCYTSQVLATCSSRPADMELIHLHPNPHHQSQRQHPLPHPQAPPPPHPHPPHPHVYSAEQNLCCGLPAFSLCHAAALSSSLQSLECLISEIHPPCIKERMLGRGYEAIGMPQLLEHQQQAHIQLPVYR